MRISIRSPPRKMAVAVMLLICIWEVKERKKQTNKQILV
jgi:hypothetical protein